MRKSLVMLILNKKIALVCFLFMTFTAPGVIAQTINSIEEDVTITGESLQGIQNPKIEANSDYQRTPKLDVTFEPEESGNGDVLFDGFISKEQDSNSPTYTLDQINTNRGDSSSKRRGTIPLANF